MRTSVSRLLAVCAVAALSFACSGNSPSSPSSNNTSTATDSVIVGGNTISPGRVAFYTSCSTCSGLSVTLDGMNIGTLTGYLTSGTPTCGDAGTLTTTARPGTLSYTARDAAGDTWGSTITVASGGCTPVRLNAPANAGGGSGGGTGGGGTGGGSTGGGSASGTGLRTQVCAAASATQSAAAWTSLPSLSGLDVKIYWSSSYNFADYIFRSRYQDRISFSYSMYRGGTPPSTGSRTNLAAGAAESGVGHGLGEVTTKGATACVVVDKVRFGPNDSGPYYQ